MSLPFFFAKNLAAAGDELELDEDSSRHVAQVLRMQAGAELQLTDGRGSRATASLVRAHKKHCTVRVGASDFYPRTGPLLTIGLSLIKNTSRFEWFLEKATEMGTARIMPLLCERTEKQSYRYERFLHIGVSAMLQSGQVWLPEIFHPRAFADVITEDGYDQQFIAHCTPRPVQSITSVHDPHLPARIVLVGPEGDFSLNEIDAAFERGFTGVSLGNTRLRTETAGVCVAALCRQY